MRPPRHRLAGLILLCAHLGLVCWLALRPLAVPWVAPANLHPFTTIRTALADGSPHALGGLLHGLLLLAPLGVLLPLAGGQLHCGAAGVWARTVGRGALISTLLVVAQSAVPGQRPNIDSVLLNTAGVALTATLLLPPVRAALLRRERAAAGRRPPGGRNPSRVGGRGRGSRATVDV